MSPSRCIAEISKSNISINLMRWRQRWWIVELMTLRNRKWRLCWCVMIVRRSIVLIINSSRRSCSLIALLIVWRSQGMISRWRRWSRIRWTWWACWRNILNSTRCWRRCVSDIAWVCHLICPIRRASGCWRLPHGRSTGCGCLIGCERWIWRIQNCVICESLKLIKRYL